MAPPKTIASPAPGPSQKGPRNRIADSLYAWCRKNHDVGHVFSQEDLLRAGIIPNKDLQILLSSVQHLVKSALFRVHDRLGGTIGWALVEEEKAKNYTGLTRDENMVLMIIDGAGASGIWTKVIKLRSQLHARVLERVYKTLEVRGFIKAMRHVKNPGRKMYISAGLEPSEEATGGAWFSEGHLDVGLVDTISKVVEHYVSQHSWHRAEPDDADDQPILPGRKRKIPSAGFEGRGEERAKAAKTNEGQHKSRGSKQTPQKYQPFAAGYTSYPTLRDITRNVLETKVTATVLPQNAIAQLLDVMVYDDRLFRVYRSPADDELPDNPSATRVTMYRCFKKPSDLVDEHVLEKHKVSSQEKIRKAACRQQELEDIGRGGTSEVPCMRCPVFDICGDGGPVNVVTCKYFDNWYGQLAEVDREMGVIQPSMMETANTKLKDATKRQDTPLTVDDDEGPAMEVALEPS